MKWPQGKWEDGIAIEKLREWLQENNFSTVNDETGLGTMFKTILCHFENKVGGLKDELKVERAQKNSYASDLSTIKRAFSILSKE